MTSARSTEEYLHPKREVVVIEGFYFVNGIPIEGGRVSICVDLTWSLYEHINKLKDPGENICTTVRRVLAQAAPKEPEDE